MLIARASDFARFDVDMSGNAPCVVTFRFPARAGTKAGFLYCRAFISSLGLTSCDRL
jgi:hypothetical protein